MSRVRAVGNTYVAMASPTSGRGASPGIVSQRRRLNLETGDNRHAITILVLRSRNARLREFTDSSPPQVWEFIRSQPRLRTDGHNIFLYQHPEQPGAPILCDFGVEVTYI